MLYKIGINVRTKIRKEIRFISIIQTNEKKCKQKCVYMKWRTILGDSGKVANRMRECTITSGCAIYFRLSDLLRQIGRKYEYFSNKLFAKPFRGLSRLENYQKGKPLENIPYKILRNNFKKSCIYKYELLRVSFK